jgi:hypothetical protein
MIAGGGCGCGANYNMTGGGVSQTGGQRGKKLETEKKTELYKKAQKYNVKGRSAMNKTELAKAIRAKQAEIGKRLSQRKKRSSKD